MSKTSVSRNLPRLMLLVDNKARDTDLNKAIRRLRMQGQHELLVTGFAFMSNFLIQTCLLSY